MPGYKIAELGGIRDISQGVIKRGEVKMQVLSGAFISGSRAILDAQRRARSQGSQILRGLGGEEKKYS